MSVTEILTFSRTPGTCYLWRFENLVLNPVHFLLTENIKRDSQWIIILFYYLYKIQTSMD